MNIKKTTGIAAIIAIACVCTACGKAATDESEATVTETSTAVTTTAPTNETTESAVTVSSGTTDAEVADVTTSAGSSTGTTTKSTDSSGGQTTTKSTDSSGGQTTTASTTAKKTTTTKKATTKAATTAKKTTTTKKTTTKKKTTTTKKATGWTDYWGNTYKDYPTDKLDGVLLSYYRLSHNQSTLADQLAVEQDCINYAMDKFNGKKTVTVFEDIEQYGWLDDYQEQTITFKYAIKLINDSSMCAWAGDTRDSSVGEYGGSSFAPGIGSLWYSLDWDDDGDGYIADDVKAAMQEYQAICRTHMDEVICGAYNSGKYANKQFTYTFDFECYYESRNDSWNDFSKGWKEYTLVLLY